MTPKFKWIQPKKPAGVPDLKIKTIKVFCARRWDNKLDCTMACDLTFHDTDQNKKKLRGYIVYLQDNCPYNKYFNDEKPKFHKVLK